MPGTRVGDVHLQDYNTRSTIGDKDKLADKIDLDDKEKIERSSRMVGQ